MAGIIASDASTRLRLCWLIGEARRWGDLRYLKLPLQAHDNRGLPPLAQNNLKLPLQAQDWALILCLKRQLQATSLFRQRVRR